MMFWIANLLLILIYGIVFFKLQKSSAFLFVSMAHLGILSALRGMSVGADTAYYAKAYKFLGMHSNVYWHAMSSSRVFVYGLKLCTKIIKDFNGYMIFTSLILFLLFTFFIYKYSNNYYISIFLFVFLYFYFNSMNTTRQYLAMAITFVAFYLLDRRRYFLVIVVGALAVGTHSAALPCVLACAIVTLIKWNPKRTTLVVVAMNLLRFVIPMSLNLFIRVMPQYSWIKKVFLDSDYTSKGRSSFFYLGYGILALCICLYWLNWQEHRVRIIAFESEIEGRKVFSFVETQILQRMIVLVSFALVLYEFYAKAILFNRMASFFYIFMIVLFSNVLDNMGGKHRWLVYMMLLPLVGFTFLQLKQGVASVTSYQFYKSIW